MSTVRTNNMIAGPSLLSMSWNDHSLPDTTVSRNGTTFNNDIAGVGDVTVATTIRCDCALCVGGLGSGRTSVLSERSASVVALITTFNRPDRYHQGR